MTPPHRLTAQTIADLAVGVELLGAGGGGNPTSLARLLGRRLGERGMDLCTPADLTGRLVSPVGVVGSSSVLLEKLPSGRELTHAVNAVCRWTAVSATAVMGIESGGLNGITAMLAALDLGVPFLDADLMGRALPRLDQFSWAVEGLPITPCCLCEPGGQVLVLDGGDAASVERTVRAFLSRAGGWAAIALAPMPVEIAAGVSHLGSALRAMKLGAAHARLPTPPTPESVATALGARVLAAGRVREVTRHGQAGSFMRGSIAILDSRSGAVVRVEAENEFLLALVDGGPLATNPDLLCLLDRRTARPLATDRVRVGDDTFVVVLPGPPWWLQTEQRLAAVAPRAFGLDTDPVLMGSSP